MSKKTITGFQLTKILKELEWSFEKAAAELGASDYRRVSEWCRGLRPVPPYIARASKFALEAHRAKAELEMKKRR